MSNLKGTEIINAIEAEIEPLYLPGAILWANQNYDNAWDKAVDRFDRALTVAKRDYRWEMAKDEGEVYKQAILGLLKKYKTNQQLDNANTFLGAVQQNFDLRGD